nr:MAG TPA: hypothetical protein [Caudoviricetes sp.]
MSLTRNSGGASYSKLIKIIKLGNRIRCRKPGLFRVKMPL